MCIAKIREKWINSYKETHNFYGILFLKFLQNINSCDKLRTQSENKTIGSELLLKYLTKFQFPLLNEGFQDIKYIF